jgi:hypothetical protein
MHSIAETKLNRINWSTLTLVVLGFWLSSSLVLDLVVIPGLAATGMTTQFGFASAGYLIFGIFNHLELLCAALVLTSFLIFRRNHIFSQSQERWSTILAGMLFAIALTYTYVLTPQMSGFGLQLNLFAPSVEMPTPMLQMQFSYWLLEVLKIVAGTTLLRWCYHSNCLMDNKLQLR